MEGIYAHSTVVPRSCNIMHSTTTLTRRRTMTNAISVLYVHRLYSNRHTH